MMGKKEAYLQQKNKLPYLPVVINFPDQHHHHHRRQSYRRLCGARYYVQNANLELHYQTPNNRIYLTRKLFINECIVHSDFNTFIIYYTMFHYTSKINIYIRLNFSALQNRSEKTMTNFLLLKIPSYTWNDNLCQKRLK